MKNSSYYIAPVGVRTHDLPHIVASKMGKVSYALTHSYHLEEFESAAGAERTMSGQTLGGIYNEDSMKKRRSYRHLHRHYYYCYLYYYRRRMQMCLHDWTKISPCVRNFTQIIAQICIRLDIASPQHLDRLLFAFVLCLFTEFFWDFATPTARTPRPPRAPLCGKVTC